ncbi:sigma factor-like helix-turn-helix DNA-binding protein [Streptomyces ovatisporus]|uniref:Sigma factor-like helix-turn-helix DNA-binding protein n=1 Tax=Streptomyces ovatisporus TaxID=1128682 RepID=A0ABV9A523_9ACTN
MSREREGAPCSGGDGQARSGRSATAETTEPTSARPAPETAAEAFDRLHEQHAPSLTRQVFLLCGRPSLARRSVRHAFRLAWQRWPDVAVDPDPAGWIRAAAYRYALAPWRHFRLLSLLRHARAMRNVPPGDRELLDALLRLPSAYRAAVLLCDGLGLSPADTAAEVEASSAATAGRLRRGRAALAERVPVLRDAAPRELPALTAALLGQLAAPQPVSLPPARHVRRLGTLRSWGATAAALGLTASVAVAGFTLVASDDERNVPRLPVPKKPSATLAPDRQPGRLLPMV